MNWTVFLICVGIVCVGAFLVRQLFLFKRNYAMMEKAYGDMKILLNKSIVQCNGFADLNKKMEEKFQFL